MNTLTLDNETIKNSVPKFSYYEKNKLIRLNYQKQYYKTNKEKIKKYTKNYYEGNKEILKKKRKEKIKNKRTQKDFKNINDIMNDDFNKICKYKKDIILNFD